MKIAYGTYGMPNVAPEEALRRLAEMGYDGVEIAVAPKYPTAPEKLGAEERARLKELLAELELGVPALMLLTNVLAEGGDAHRENLESLRKAAELAVDVLAEGCRVITTTLGGATQKWEAQRDEFAGRLRDFASVVSDAGCLLAIEPHYGGAVDRPDRALWLLEAIDSPVVKLNFDISHFDLLGLTLEETVPVLVPHSIHTHVKDGRKLEKGIEFLLPGQGAFDYVAYLEAMRSAGWNDYITVEISGMIWSREDYDPFAAAKYSYDTLDSAFRRAGIDRG